MNVILTCFEAFVLVSHLLTRVSKRARQETLWRNLFMRYVPFNGSLCASVPSEFTLHRDMRSQRQSRKGTHTWLIPILLTLPLSKQKHPCDSNTTKWRRQSWSSLSVAKTTRMQNSVATQRSIDRWSCNKCYIEAKYSTKCVEFD